MVVLDTDYMSLLERAEAELAQRLQARLDAIEPGDWATTVISYEEQLRGWLSFIASARTIAQEIVAYGKLKRQLINYSNLLVLDFDELAATKFQMLRKAKLRLGTMDLKIAAIVLALDATLLTRNVSDFSRVPGLKVEDWTREETTP